MRLIVDGARDGVAAPVAYPHQDAGDRGRRYFGDVAFPAYRDDLWRSAVEHGAPREVLEVLRALPKERYAHPEELPDLYEAARQLGPP